MEWTSKCVVSRVGGRETLHQRGWAGGRAHHHTADMATTTGLRLFRRSVPLAPGKKAAASVAAGNQAAAMALKSLGPRSCKGSGAEGAERGNRGG